MSYEQDKNIYLILHEGGLTPEGAAGSMGNMCAESSMKADIAQRGMTTLTDEQYTKAVDMGMISAYDFAHDGAGYGLCQWTYPPRKANLLAYAQRCGVSIGDETMQVHFYLKELSEDYPDLYHFLCTSNNLKECSDRVCKEFERPAYNNLEQRFQFALDFYTKYSDLEAPAPQAPTLGFNNISIEPDAPVQIFQNGNVVNTNPSFSFNDFMSGLWNSITGTKEKSMVSAKMPVLKEGDQGVGVAAIQVALKYHKINIGDTGTLGIWETGTTIGLKDFQSKHAIQPTGIMDAHTWEELFK